MRRSRHLRLAELPRLALQALMEVAALFGGRYRRTEGAHVLVRDDHGRILVVRTTYLGPGWMLPGGRVERTETPHAAARRETREETGIEVRVDRLVLVDAHRRQNVSFIYAATAVGGELAPQFGEIAEVGWLERHEIAETSWRLDRLLSLLAEAEGDVAYIGLGAPRIET
jgi:8-oxo-dGTP diphosphatase